MIRAVLLVALLVACASGAPDPQSPSARCPDVELGVLLAECKQQVAAECGTPARAECPAKAECHARVTRWHDCNPQEAP